jgi:hypothetical protein
MADNVSYTPGSGVNIAADDVGGVLFQRVKIATGADGTAVDATESNPIPVAAYGELMETLQAMRLALELVAKNLSWLGFNTAMQARVVFDTNSSMNSLSSCSQLLRAGGLNFDLGQAFKDFSVLTADNLRRNITVT